jgi:dTMP kinase
MARGRLITIEGIDGAGKSTLAAALAQELTARGISVELIREPGGVEVSERIRALVTDPELLIGPRTEALLYAAARAQLVEQLLTPRLREGVLLLLDRFIDSSLAYQGGGRGLGVDPVRAINRFAAGTVTPDRTLLLRITPDAGLARREAQERGPDRLEREGGAFFESIAAAYEELAAAEPDRIRVIDALGSPQQVLDDALGAIEDLLPARYPPRASRQ